MAEDQSTDTGTDQATDDAAQHTGDQDQNTDAGTSTGTSDDAGIDWKAQARKHEARAKEHAAAAKELAALKKSQMSDAEKLQATTAEATERAAKAEAKAAVLEAALAHGITDKADLAMLAELPADKVDAFAKRLATAAKPPAGRSGNEVGGTKAAASLEQQIADATKAGNHTLAIALKQQRFATH